MAITFFTLVSRTVRMLLVSQSQTSCTKRKRLESLFPLAGSRNETSPPTQVKYISPFGHLFCPLPLMKQRGTSRLFRADRTIHFPYHQARLREHPSPCRCTRPTHNSNPIPL